MEFYVVARYGIPHSPGPGAAYLVSDNWNDFGFVTLFHLVLFDMDGNRNDLGAVKIGQHGMTSRHTRLPDSFSALDDRYFSLGQDADYYDGIAKLGADEAKELLEGLRDVVADDELYQRAKSQEVLGVSLMRSVTERTLLGQFRRILRGEARLTPYTFRYFGPQQIDPACEPVEMSFEVEPLSRPPTNVHVLIGRNGVGKSHLLNAMSRALAMREKKPQDDGWFADPPQPFFRDDANDTFANPFANVVSVTFSAFDDFPVVPRAKNVLKAVQYTNVGLRKVSIVEDKGTRKHNVIVRQPDDLSRDFIESAKVCSLDDRRDRWIAALNTLQSDPVFEESGVTALPHFPKKGFGRRAGRLFRKLSSGHKIVLLTITKLVEKVDERTLVLMDEPESHLHPPFLAGFVRALSDLLINRNGVAIIATHSPVVLQEVPRTCVWRVRRYGGRAMAERVPVETFAEHVGTLTHEVFGLEVTKSGFHKMISDAVRPEDSFEEVEERFDGGLGSEGRALVAALIARERLGDVEDYG